MSIERTRVESGHRKTRPLTHLTAMALTVVAVGLTVLGGCGGDSPQVPTRTDPTPTPCTQSVVFGGQGNLPPLTVDYETFATTATGRLDITLDWTLDSSLMFVGVVQADACPFEQFKAGTCNFLVAAGGPGSGGPPGTKPIKVSTANFAAGRYNLLIFNASPQDEAVAIQLVLSQGSCAALTSTTSAGTSSPRGIRALESAVQWVGRAIRQRK